MAEAGSIYVDFYARDGYFQKGMERINGRIEQTTEKLDRFGSKASAMITLPLTAAAGAALKVAADMESAEVAFTTMLGSADRAADLLDDLYSFASSTPFEISEIQAAGKSLLAFGFEAENIEGVLENVGNVAAGINAPIGDIASIFGKARTSGRLFAEDINQLTERGIPIISELAKQFGVAESEIRGLVSEGQVGFENLQKAFESMNGEGGQFAGLMEAQSKTLGGAFSNMQDSVYQLFGAIGTGLNKTLGLSAAISKLSGFIEGLAESISGFAEANPMLFKMAAGLAGIAAAAGPVALGISGFLKLLPALKTGFTALTALSGPVGIALAAIAGGAYLIIKNWEDVKPVIMDAYEAIKPTMAALADVVRNAVGVIGAILQNFVRIGEGIWDTFGEHIIANFKNVWTIVSSTLEGALGVISSALNIFIQVFSGNWEGLWDGILTFLKSTVNLAIGVVQSLMTAILSMLRNIASVSDIVFGTNLSGAIQKGIDKLNQFADALKFKNPKLKIDITEAEQKVKSVEQAVERVQKKASGITSIPAVQAQAPGEMPTGARGSLDVPSVQSDTIQKTEQLTDRMKTLQQGVDQVGQSIQNSLADTFAGIGTAIGKGESLMSVVGNMGTTLLSSLGDIAIKTGTMVITTGKAIEAVKSALTSLNPVAALAAGGALIGIGIAFKAGAAAIGNSMGSSSGGKWTGAAPTGMRGAGSMNTAAPSYPSHRNSFRGGGSMVPSKLAVEGDQLVLLMDRVSSKRSRHGQNTVGLHQRR